MIRTAQTYVLAAIGGLLLFGTENSAKALCQAPAIDHSGHINEHTRAVEGTEALQIALDDANKGLSTQLLLAAGTYELSTPLIIKQRGLTIRSQSGNRDDVILRGQGMNTGITQVLLVEAPDFTLADVTVGWVQHHAVQVRG